MHTHALKTDSNTDPDLYHRSHEVLQSYWNHLRGARLFPRESEIDPEVIADIWESCFLIGNDEVARQSGYCYSFLGCDLLAAFGDDITDHDTALRLLSTARMPNARKFDEVFMEKRPVIDEAEFVNLMGMEIRYRSCLLPLGLENGEVTHLIGCMRWRAY